MELLVLSFQTVLSQRPSDSGHVRLWPEFYFDSQILVKAATRVDSTGSQSLAASATKRLRQEVSCKVTSHPLLSSTSKHGLPPQLAVFRGEFPKSRILHSEYPYERVLKRLETPRPSLVLPFEDEQATSRINSVQTNTNLFRGKHEYE